jgi:hypothetical protein
MTRTRISTICLMKNCPLLFAGMLTITNAKRLLEASGTQDSVLGILDFPQKARDHIVDEASNGDPLRNPWVTAKFL